MKKDTVQKPAEPQSSAAGAPKEAAAPPPPDLGLLERRKFIRPLPVPDVEESDGDSVWGTFQSLSAKDSNP